MAALTAPRLFKKRSSRQYVYESFFRIGAGRQSRHITRSKQGVATPRSVGGAEVYSMDAKDCSPNSFFVQQIFTTLLAKIHKSGDNIRKRQKFFRIVFRLTASVFCMKLVFSYRKRILQVASSSLLNADV
jgi:hypothetical protein